MGGYNPKSPRQSEKVDLTKEECYTGIDQFYKLIAEKLGYSSNKVHFDCRKISVTKPVMDQIFAFYTEERKMSEGAIAQGWVSFGPKAEIPKDRYLAVVHHGFILEDTL